MAQRGSPARRQASVAGRRVASRASTEAGEVATTTKRQAKRVASTATERGRAVAQTTAEDAKTVVSTARDQAAQVAQEASTQAGELVDQARSQLQDQLAAQLQRLAENLDYLGGEAVALTEGRPDEAPALGDYVAQAADALYRAADAVHAMGDDIQSQGLQAVVEDVQRFARRRPGLFLLGAALAGFSVGRAVRAGKAEGDDIAGGDGPASTRARRPPDGARTSRALPAGGGPARSRTTTGTR